MGTKISPLGGVWPHSVHLGPPNISESKRARKLTLKTVAPPLFTEVFYINICGFIVSGKFIYETRVIDNNYLQFKFKLPTYDSTQITAGAPKVPIEGFV